MNSILKTALTVSALFILPGCMDCSWCGKKEQNHEIIEAAAPIQEEHEHANSGKCSRKGCTHNHSKDSHTKHHSKKHNEDAHIQSIGDMDDEDDIEIQSMNEDYIEEEEEEYND